jgi:hypothetical protein
MTRNPSALTGIVLALGFASRAALATEPALAGDLTVDQIVDRYVSARGGTEVWQKTKTMAWTGHVESGAEGSNKAQFMMLFKRPDSTRFEVIVQGQHIVRAFDGSAGWKLQPTGGGVPEVKHFSAEELSYARDTGGVEGPLFDYRAKGVTISLQGQEPIAGHQAYRLKLTLPSGQTRTDWIDAQSFLELKYDREAHAPSGRSATVSVYYGDYRSVQGLLMPFSIETGGAPGTGSDKMVIEKIAINPPLDDGLFSEPVKTLQRHKSVVIDTTREPPK